MAAVAGQLKRIEGCGFAQAPGAARTALGQLMLPVVGGNWETCAAAAGRAEYCQQPFVGLAAPSTAADRDRYRSMKQHYRCYDAAVDQRRSS